MHNWFRTLSRYIYFYILSSNQSIADEKHFVILYHDLKNISYQNKMSTSLKSNRKLIILTENRSCTHTHTELKNMHSFNKSIPPQRKKNESQSLHKHKMHNKGTNLVCLKYIFMLSKI